MTHKFTQPVEFAAPVTFEANPNLGAVVPDATFQCFNLGIRNNAGTIEHAIVEASDFDVTGLAAPAALVSRINNPTATWTASPTGTDSSTAFAAGGKISSVSPQVFILDEVGASIAATFAMDAYRIKHDTNDNFQVSVGYSSFNVNGSTKSRLFIGFFNQDGTNYNINATNITVGQFITIRFTGWMA